MDSAPSAFQISFVFVYRGATLADYNYTVYLEPIPEGGYQVVFRSIPEIVTFGNTVEEARRAAKEALRCHLEGLVKDGEALPIEHSPLGDLLKETVAISI